MAPSRSAAAVLALLAMLQGCASLPFKPRQTLHVVLVPTERMDWLRNDYLRGGQTLQPLLKAFSNLHPNVDVEISLQSQSTIEESLRASSNRGLSPDLLMLRSPEAVALKQKGLIDPLPQGQPTIKALLQLIDPKDFSRVSTPQGLVGMPVYSEFTLACYDRRRLSNPPNTLSELLSVAASGQTVGLSVDPIGLWFTAGALGAQQAMTPIVTGNADSSPQSTDQARLSLLNWLSWLRYAALQSRVEITSGPQELVLGLESGQFAWVPCFSLTLKRLDRTMGRHLGLAPLPSGPAGYASPFSTTMVWALGRDSTPQQRRLSLQFLALSLDPLIQRQLMMLSHSLLPANRYVPIPVSSSGRLAALVAANQQFRRNSGLQSTAFSNDYEQSLLPLLKAIVTNVVVGVTTPQQGVEELLRLRPKSTGAH